MQYNPMNTVLETESDKIKKGFQEQITVHVRDIVSLQNKINKLKKAVTALKENETKALADLQTTIQSI